MTRAAQMTTNYICFTFNELVAIMVEKDPERWQLWAKGEHFPWDAWNYPNEKKILSRKVKLE